MQTSANVNRQVAPELPGLTALRGLAAIGVVLFHVDVCLFYRELGTLVPKASTGLISNGYLWVDFFFILSGYVIHHAYASRLGSGLRWRSAAAFFGARFFRIYPLHLALTLLLLGAIMTFGAMRPDLKDGSWAAFFDVAKLPANLLLTHAMMPGGGLSWNIVSWSIAAEWWVYAVAPLLIPLLARQSRVAGIACIAVGLVVLATLYGLVGRDTLDITFDFGVIRCLGGFLIGLGLYGLFRRAAPLSARAADGLSVFAAAGIALVMHFDVLDLLVIPLFAALVIAGSNPNARINQILSAAVPQYLGRISYSIYLVHGLVFMAFWFGAPLLDLRFDTPAAAWAFAAAFLALTIGGAALSHRLIELPAQAFGRGLNSPAPKKAAL